MLLLTYFVIGSTYNNKMYAQSHENVLMYSGLSQISYLSGLWQDQLPIIN